MPLVRADPSLKTPNHDEPWFCPKCGYDVRAMDAARCSECGFAYEHDAIVELARHYYHDSARVYRIAVSEALCGAALVFVTNVLPRWMGQPSPVIGIAVMLAIGMYVWLAVEWRWSRFTLIMGMPLASVIAANALFAWIVGIAAIGVSLATIIVGGRESLIREHPYLAMSLSEGARCSLARWRWATWVVIGISVIILMSR